MMARAAAILQVTPPRIRPIVRHTPLSTAAASKAQEVAFAFDTWTQQRPFISNVAIAGAKGVSADLCAQGAAQASAFKLLPFAHRKCLLSLPSSHVS
jgi:23S rRNA pseudoU1915 N3-methylase RlmH